VNDGTSLFETPRSLARGVDGEIEAARDAISVAVPLDKDCYETDQKRL